MHDEIGPKVVTTFVMRERIKQRRLAKHPGRSASRRKKLISGKRIRIAWKTDRLLEKLNRRFAAIKPNEPAGCRERLANRTSIRIMRRQFFGRVAWQTRLVTRTSLVETLARMQATVVTMRSRARDAVPVRMTRSVSFSSTATHTRRIMAIGNMNPCRQMPQANQGQQQCSREGSE